MDRIQTVVVMTLVGALVGGAGFFWWRGQRPAAPTEPAVPVAVESAAPPPLAAASEPAIRHPIAPASAPGAALPALAAADQRVGAELDALFGRRTVLTMLQTSGFVPHAVATIDNLARSHAAPRLWPVNPTPGRFSTDRRGKTVLPGADNAARYAGFVALIESVDAAEAVATYRELYPLFQQAYEELGYPGRYFNDRLVDVIDHLLLTPEPEQPPALQLTEVRGPVQPVRPWVRWEYADPALESLSSGQKILLRMGLDQQRRVKAKLRELRYWVASGGPPAGAAAQ